MNCTILCCLHKMVQFSSKKNHLFFLKSDYICFICYPHFNSKITSFFIKNVLVNLSSVPNRIAVKKRHCAEADNGCRTFEDLFSIFTFLKNNNA